MKIKKLGFNRIFIESGATFISQLINKKLINNLYLFKSSKNLSAKGKNNCNLNRIKKIKMTKKNEVKVNLFGDNLYKVKL